MSHPVPYVPIATGWVDSPADVAATLDALSDTQAVPPYFGAAAPGLVLDGADDDRPVFFQDAEQKILGRILSSWNQGSVGTCVSFGYGRGAQDLLLLEIASGQAEEWPGAEVATEPIYGGSRVEVGGGRISGDGSVGAWAAKWVKEWGVVVRGVYGPHDLTRYSGDLSRRWGRDGVPAEIEALARLHPVKAVALVETAAQLWAALGNGYPVPVCSNQGFTSELVGGFCEPSGSWAHCMLWRGRFVHPERGRAYVCQNSWGGQYLRGDRRFKYLASDGTVQEKELPEGCFCVTEAVADRMLRQRDSFALSDFAGFPARPRLLDWIV